MRCTWEVFLSKQSFGKMERHVWAVGRRREKAGKEGDKGTVGGHV